MIVTVSHTIIDAYIDGIDQRDDRKNKPKLFDEFVELNHSSRFFIFGYYNLSIVRTNDMPFGK